MSASERFRRKLAAFLDDPIGTSLLAGRHEERTARTASLADRLDLPLSSFDPAAGHLASAIERAFVPEKRPDGSPLSVSFLDDPEIRHPFSGQVLERAGSREPLVENDLSVDDLEGILEESLDRLRLSELISQGNERRAFFTLWRNWRSALEQASPEALMPYWSVLPADPRVPDHGLIQDLQTASAFSGVTRSDGGLTTDATFLLVTLGPAQAFIKEARKTKDLYWGSALLSRLTWAGMRPVVEEFGPDAVLFPDLFRQPLVDRWLETDVGLDLLGDSQAEKEYLPTLPNRFFAVVEAEDEEARQGLLERIESGVYEALEKRAADILSEVCSEKVVGEVRSTQCRHLRDALSVYGVALPFQPPGGALTTDRILGEVQPYMSDRELQRTKALLDLAEGPHTQYDEGPGQTYSLLYSLTEKMLAAQKNTRAFDQLPANCRSDRSSGERGRKCSLCGERNALFYRGTPAQIHHNDPAVSLDSVSSVDVAQMRDGEGLCGMCVTKRFADRALPGRPGGFPSTAEVALAPLLDDYGGQFGKVQTELRRALGGEGTFDAQLYFDENLRPGYLAKYVYEEKDEAEDAEELENAAQRLREIHASTLQESGLASQMTRYYGLLVLDGDHMGHWVSGDKAPTFEDIYHSSLWPELPEPLREELKALRTRPLTPALHASLSRALSSYALEAVRPIVEEEFNGSLVYAGGDDVLAFVPLREALDVALHLRAAFSGHRDPGGGKVDFGKDTEKDISGFRQRDGRVVTTLGPEASASVGLALAHYKTPLGEVLDTAYRMEERAKETGRDRLALAVLKRSGDQSEGAVPFTSEEIHHRRGVLSVFQTLLEDLQDRDLSPTFIRALRRELRPLLDETGAFAGEVGASDAELLLRSEIGRLLRRSLATEDPKWIEATTDRLVAAWKAIGRVGTFLEVLDTMLFLHRETKSSHVRADHAP